MSQQIIQWYRDKTDCLAPNSVLAFRAHENFSKVSCCCNLDIAKAGKNDLEFLSRVKSTLESGTKAKECHRCWDDEDHGLISERLRYHIQHSYSEEIRRTLPGPHESYDFSIKFSNLCPLYCRSCDSSESSSWARITKTTDKVPAAVAHDITDDEESWEFIKAQIKQLASKYGNKFFLSCIGGEVVLQPGFYKLLDWLEENELQSLIQLRITTSFTSGITQSLLDRLMRFHGITLSLSIDSVKENYGLVRNPVKFSKVENNLGILSEIYHREKAINPWKIDLWITPVFSLNNVFYIEEYLDWWMNWIKLNNIFPNFTNINLHHPSALRIDTLPAQYRDSLLQHLDRCSKHEVLKTDNFAAIRSWIDSTSDSLNASTEPIGRFEDFLKFTADFDKRSGVSSLTHNKKLFDILSKEHRAIYDQYYTIVDVNQPIGQSR